MTTTASLFLGEMASTWSLVRAAVAFGLIKQQLFGMDLLIQRKARGVLRSYQDSKGFASCPLEVLDMIKDEVYAFGIESVTASWTADYLRDVNQGCEPDDLWQAPQKISEVITSRGWEQWADPEPDPWFFSEWAWDNEYIHCRQRLVTHEKPEVREFLATLGLSMLRHTSGWNQMPEKHSGFVSRLERIFLPIYIRLGHIKTNGVAFEASYDEGVACATQDIAIEDLLKPPASHRAFNILYWKYQVEFVKPLPKLPPTPPSAIHNRRRVNAVSSDGESEMERKKSLPSPPNLLRKPNLRWMLWADGDMNA